MTHTIFRTVFDVSQVPLDWKYLFLPGLAGIAFAVVFPIIVGWRYPKSRAWKLYGWAGSVVAIVWVGMWSGGGTIAALRARQALNEGRYEVIEGEVMDFVPMPAFHHAEESFSVKGVRFHYSGYGFMRALRDSQLPGRGLGPGRFVRIAYSDSEILKLEIAEVDP
jgi:hypothetical protein